jgi:trimeric autotransporter adhesin
MKPFFYLMTLAVCSGYLAQAQPVDYSKSYVNLNRKTAGGTIRPGDTLEIRFTFFVRNGIVADSCAVYDNIPINTTLIPDSLVLRTNEGLRFRPRYTSALDGDQGTVTGASLRIHLGAGANAVARGRITGASDKPRFYSVGCIIMATYQVRVNTGVPDNTIINIGGGSLTYKIGTASLTTINFPATRIIVYQNRPFCNSSSSSNAIVSESNGTFGSGRNKNRGASAVVPANYTYTNFGANTPNDYFYGVSNNSSGNYGTSNAIPYPDASNRRVFQVWDIIGDHTGAVNPNLGNPATDTIPSGANGGYMAVINASYRTDSAFSPEYLLRIFGLVL